MTPAALPPEPGRPVDPAPAPGSRAARHGSAATPLAWAWAALIVYASLHPFAPWHWPAPASWSLLWLPWPVYHQRFDLVSNLLAYVPLGALATLAGLRHGRPLLRAAGTALLAGVLLSLLMEWLQELLPMRVPSRVDWLLNSAGTLLGVLLAALASMAGLLQRWQNARERWLVPHPSLGMLLLVLWPVGLLFPPPVPLGLGQGLGAAAVRVDAWLSDTFLDGWIPLPAPNPTALSPGAEVLTIALGLLAPCFVGFSITRRGWRRIPLLLGAALLGLGATTLSTALNFGPDHALAWWTPPVGPAFALGLLAGLGLAWAPTRLVAGLGLAALTLHLALVNQASTDPYFAQSLLDWEQGRFIRFHGLAQWVGWLWPLAALAYLMVRLGARNDPGSPE